MVRGNAAPGSSSDLFNTPLLFDIFFFLLVKGSFCWGSIRQTSSFFIFYFIFLRILFVVNIPARKY
ncbi:hypothetical protein HOY80DRAFT_423796 [Tuber brumale]|nr:hypothetical protein HOY80DRAFT_423796 [Tuber brumale]